MPSNFKRLEYIQSTGTQYINTGIVPTNANETKAQFRFALTDITNGENQSIGSNSNMNMYAAPSLLKFRTNAVEIANFDTQWHDVEISKSSSGKTTVFDGVAYNTSVTTQDATPFYLFAMSAGGGLYSGKYKLSYTKIYENDAIVRYLIPVQRISDSVVGMYDTVTGTFFTNSGTGTFTAGPEM